MYPAIIMPSGLQWNQVSSDRIDITWTLSKTAKSHFAALYSNSGILLDTLNTGGEVRGVWATLSQVGIPFKVTITATYYDNTSGTGSVEIWRSY